MRGRSAPGVVDRLIDWVAAIFGRAPKPVPVPVRVRVDHRPCAVRRNEYR